MKIKNVLLSLPLLLSSSLPAVAQAVNASQQVTLQGVRSNAGAGSFVAATYAADGTLFCSTTKETAYEF